MEDLRPMTPASDTTVAEEGSCESCQLTPGYDCSSCMARRAHGDARSRDNYTLCASCGTMSSRTKEIVLPELDTPRASKSPSPRPDACYDCGAVGVPLFICLHDQCRKMYLSMCGKCMEISHAGHAHEQHTGDADQICRMTEGRLHLMVNPIDRTINEIQAAVCHIESKTNEFCESLSRYTLDMANARECFTPSESFRVIKEAEGRLRRVNEIMYAVALLKDVMEQELTPPPHGSPAPLSPF